MTNYRAATNDDWSVIERRILACDLPVAGARAHLGAFIVAVDDGAIVGCVGAEVYGGDALLRSLAVRDDRRGSGIGDALVAQMLGTLRGRGVRCVALLTTTAEAFFARRQFVAVSREDVPAALHASAEFQGACPASAVAMVSPLILPKLPLN